MIRQIVNCCIVASLLLFSELAVGQAKPLEPALLWEISGRDLARPSYIYGTIHMICEKDFFISEKLKNAIGSVDEVVFELKLDDPGLDQKMKDAMTSAVPLAVRLGEPRYRMLDSIFRLKTNIALAKLQNMELSALTMILSSIMLNCGQPTSYEKILLSMAKEHQKKVSGFETVEAQMSFFKKAYTDSVLFNQLMDIDKGTLLSDKIVSLYKQQDLSGMYALIDDALFKKWILEIRNQNWLALMPEIMRKNSTLFAVGAAHLGGDFGLINSLKEMGYVIKPM